MMLTANNNDKKKTKTAQGERLAEVILEMGETERSFALKVGYKHPSTVYAAEHGRIISPKLMKKILDQYEKTLKKSLNPEWLLNGIPPKLLTSEKKELLTGNKDDSNRIKPIGQEEKDHSTRETIRTEESYYLLFKEKERYIKALEERIEELKKTISFQEECIRGFKSYFPGEKNTG